MNYTIKHLQAFIAIAREGSYSSAAQHLHLTRPSLSLTIKELESQLGFPVFFRTTRRVALTEEGKAFMPHAEKVLAEYRNSLWVAKNVMLRTEGTLKVASSQLMACTYLPDIVERYYALYPDVDIEIVYVPYDRVDGIVLSGQADVGLGAERPLTETSTATILFSLPVSCLCSSAHPFARMESVTWEQLSRERIITSDPGSLRMLMSDIHYSAQLTPSLEVHHLMTALALVSKNVGIMPCMRHVERLLPIYDIRMIPITSPSVDRRIIMVTDSARLLSKAATAFANLAVEMFAGSTPSTLPAHGSRLARPPKPPRKNVRIPNGQRIA